MLYCARVSCLLVVQRRKVAEILFVLVYQLDPLLDFKTLVFVVVAESLLVARGHAQSALLGDDGFFGVCRLDFVADFGHRLFLGFLSLLFGFDGIGRLMIEGGFVSFLEI